jgi:hypothetical protein
MKLVRSENGAVVEVIQFNENIDEINEWLRPYDIEPTWIHLRTQPHNEWHVYLGPMEGNLPWRVYSGCWVIKFEEPPYDDQSNFIIQTNQHVLLYYKSIPDPLPEYEMWDFIKI